ncbi:MAG: hypothetical protein AABZ47_16615 [Planctomycetota bacterium]
MSLDDAGRDFGVEAVASRVRGNAGSAGLGAACLLVFGFFMFSPPAVTSAFTFGDALATWTMRIGGVAIAAIAGLSLLGKSWVLMFDGIISVPIGLCLATAGVVMVANGGSMMQILYVIFGGTFVSGGIRNGRAFLAIRRRFVSASGVEPAIGEGNSHWTPAGDDVAKVSPALLKRHAFSESAPQQRVPMASPASSDVPVAPPPSGYLASFARKRDADASLPRPE